MDRSADDFGLWQAALVAITRPVAETGTFDVEVTTQKMNAGSKSIGYLVSFDYHH